MKGTKYSCEDHGGTGFKSDCLDRKCKSSTSPGCSTTSPWTPRDCVKKLIEAADILLDNHDYDGHGWELIHEARARAKDWVKQ